MMSFIVPVLGILMTGYLSMATYNYLKSLKVYRKNEQRVKDPFKNMRFDHVKCSQLKKNYHFIKINFKSIFFVIKRLKLRVQFQGKRLTGRITEKIRTNFIVDDIQLGVFVILYGFSEV
jgi:hypothetical protein